jgi:hypothetical protein
MRGFPVKAFCQYLSRAGDHRYNRQAYGKHIKWQRSLERNSQDADHCGEKDVPY